MGTSSSSTSSCLSAVRSIMPMSMIRSRFLKKVDSPTGALSEAEDHDADWLSTRPRTITWFHLPKRRQTLCITLLVLLLVLSFQKTSLVSYLHSNKAQAVFDQKHALYKPPLVDRKILDKLERSDESDDRSEEADSDVLPTVLRWPPRVTKIPEQHSADISPNLSTLLSPADFEKQFCSPASIDPATSSCRFILPLWISEQESKSRIHLLQLLQLARSLNRTLVLPNVGKNRLGTCLKWEFDLYYNTKHFLGQMGTIVNEDNEYSGKIDVITMERFKFWMNNRLVRPVAQIISLNRTTPTGHNTKQLNSLPVFRRRELDLYIHHDTIDPSTQLKRAYCLSSKFNRLDTNNTFSAISIVFTTTHSPRDLKDHSPAQALVEELINGDTLLAAHRGPTVPDVHSEARFKELPKYTGDYVGTGSDLFPSPDVLIINWDLRLPLFSAPLSSSGPRALATINYSRKLQALTTRLTKPISPYLAVYWRMESVSPEVLPTCAENLVSTLHDILNNDKKAIGSGISHIWFATDVPFIPDPSNKSTVSNENGGGSVSLTEGHLQALQILRDAFSSKYGGLLSRFKLTRLGDELARMKRDGEEIDDLVDGNSRQEEVLDDSGVLGILDKLVVMRSALFVRGGNGCGRVSSFTRQIVEWREMHVSSGSDLMGAAQSDSGLRNVVYKFW